MDHSFYFGLLILCNSYLFQSTLLVSAGNAEDADATVPEEQPSEAPQATTATSWTDVCHERKTQYLNLY